MSGVVLLMTAGVCVLARGYYWQRGVVAQPISIIFV